MIKVCTGYFELKNVLNLDSVMVVKVEGLPLAEYKLSVCSKFRKDKHLVQHFI